MWNPRRFAQNLILYTVSVWLVTVFLHMLFNLQSTQLAATFVPAMFAALQEGQKYACSTGHRPEKSDIWKLSRVMAEVYLTTSVVLSVIAAVLSPEIRYVYAHIPLVVLFVIYGIFTGIALVVMRWGYSLGIKLGLQEREKNTG